MGPPVWGSRRAKAHKLKAVKLAARPIMACVPRLLVAGPLPALRGLTAFSGLSWVQGEVPGLFGGTLSLTPSAGRRLDHP